MRVLDQNGSIRQMLPSQVSNKIEQRKDAIATDRNGSEIRFGDVVREAGGESKSGVIIHIHRAFVYVHDRTQTENAGVFVTRCVNVTTVAAKGGRATAADAKTNSAMHMKNGDGPSGPMAPPKSLGRDRLIGKTVSVRKGPYKGVLGIVKNTTETTARIEMHSKAKIITIDKDELVVKECVPLASLSIALLINWQSHDRPNYRYVALRWTQSFWCSPPWIRWGFCFLKDTRRLVWESDTYGCW